MFSAHTVAEGSFYRVVSHTAMVGAFGSTGLFVLVALAIGFRNFWRETAAGAGSWLDPPAMGRALWDSARLRYLDGGGEGCAYPDERASAKRQTFHHLTFYGFLLCLASTSTAAIYHNLLGWEAPYELLERPRRARLRRGRRAPRRDARPSRSQARPRPGARGCASEPHRRLLPRALVSHEPHRPSAAAPARDGGDGPRSRRPSGGSHGTVSDDALRQVRARHLSIRRAPPLRAGGARVVKKISRYALALLAALGVAGCSGAPPASSTLTLLAPAAPGGGWDQTARVMQQVFRDTGLAPHGAGRQRPGGGRRHRTGPGRQRS